MLQYQRTSNSIALKWGAEVPTVWTLVYGPLGASGAPVAVSGMVFGQTHDISYGELHSDCLYNFRGDLWDDQGLPADHLDLTLRTLGDYTIDQIRIDPQNDGFTITAATSVPAALRITGESAQLTRVLYESANLSARRDTIEITGLPPGVEFALRFDFTAPEGSLYALYRAQVRPIFKYDTLDPVFQHLVDGAQILCQYTGDVLLGITAFLNAVKYNLRYAKLSDYAPAAVPLEDRQIKAFEDQMSYYYANAAKAQDPQVLVRLAYEWFRYDNVDRLDPLAAPMTPEQKIAMMRIIKQVADNYVLSATVAQIKQTINKLNRLELVPEGAPLRNAYNALGATQLAPPVQIDFMRLLDSGVTPLEPVETP
jgi:hypothetical protein